MFAPQFAVVFILLSVVLMKYKKLYQEIFLGFLLVLILSDSRYRGFSFVVDTKVFYIVLLAFFLFFDKKDFQKGNRLFFLFVPFFLFTLFLVFASEDWSTSFQKYLSYVLLLVLVPHYIIRIYSEQGSHFFKNVTFLFVLILLIGIVLKFTNPGIAILANRYRGLFGNPNGIGLFCTLFFLLFVLIKEYFPNLFSIRENILVFTVIILSVVLSGSRNTIMSILCFIIFQRVYSMSPFLGLLILCGIVVGYEVVLENLESIIRYFNLGSYFRLETLDTGSGRNVAWAFAWHHIQENFFFGGGVAFDETLFAKNAYQLQNEGHQGNIHNSFLTFWLNTGIFGLFLFLRGLFLAFFKGSKNSRIAFPIMLTILFSANFESWMSASLNPVTIQLWIILTVLISPEFNENKDSLPLY
jgi:O-antigen ligase